MHVNVFCEASKESVRLSITLHDILHHVRQEILTKYEFYQNFYADDEDVLTDVDNFLSNSLKYCNSYTPNLLLIALGKTFEANVVVFQSNKEKCWILNMSDNIDEFTKNLYFGRTAFMHIDPI